MPHHLSSATGHAIPAIGMGVMQIPDADIPATIRTATDLGYRAFDTAPVYDNEPGVGRGLHASGVLREELYLTTKLWNSEQGYDPAIRACKASLDALALDRIDLYLIHWPVPSLDLYVESWRALIQLRDDGLVGAIGVSNFQPDHLRRIVDETGVVPAVNQVELHPAFQQRALRVVHAEMGIVTQAWSPLGRGATLADPNVVALAKARDLTPAQLVLAWLVQQEIAVIPKASSAGHLAENLTALDVTLDAEAMAALDAMDDASGRFGPDPDSFAVTQLTRR